MREEIVSRLRALHAQRPCVLVAIDGPGAAGKTTLAQAIARDLIAARTPTAVVHIDDFFLPSVQRPRGEPTTKPIGGDFDWPRLREEVLLPLRSGHVARYHRYDWERDIVADVQHLSPGGVVIVEGIYASRRELADLYDFRVWVDCPREIRLARGLDRDGVTARERWEQDWIPSEDCYMEQHRPKEYADVVVTSTTV